LGENLNHFPAGRRGQGVRHHGDLYDLDQHNEFSNTERCFKADLPAQSEEDCVTIPVKAIIDRFRLAPDDRPFSFSISEIVLLSSAPETAGSELEKADVRQIR
jgi:hypothetical protein